MEKKTETNELTVVDVGVDVGCYSDSVNNRISGYV
jgi:hypothetical protein